MTPLFCPINHQQQGRASGRIRLPDTAMLIGLVFFAGLYFGVVNPLSAQENLLDGRITLNRIHSTLYEALNRIGEEAGCTFVYDSRIVDNEKKVRINAVDEPLSKILDRLLDDPSLEYKVIGKHLLIYRSTTVLPDSEEIVQVRSIDTVKPLTIKGYVIDNLNREPVPFATVGIPDQKVGTITNTDGYFILKVPPAFSGSSLVVSHLGFVSQSIPLQLINEQKVDFYMNRRVISIQEVIIRYVDPVTIVGKAIEQRKLNYNSEPVYLTSFYREGVQKNGQTINYSEAVFKVYKSSYDKDDTYDQVKLLKSRKFQNTAASDTVLLKLKAGIRAGLQLDIIKNLPDFLDPEQLALYDFTYSDLVSYEDQDAYAITFSSNINIEDAFYTGTLYIEKERFAILGVDFEVNPLTIDRAASQLVQKKSKHIKVKFEKISYSVKYSLYNGIYYPNHARSELRIKTRLRNRLSYDHFTTFMEIVTCGIDTTNVSRFERQEVVRPDAVFSDATYLYDHSFWEDYNFVAPEARIEEALSRIQGKIDAID